MTTLEQEPAERLEMNEIGVLRIETGRPIYFDAYTQNRATGSFVLIDPATNATAGAGMILAVVAQERLQASRGSIRVKADRVTPAERLARYRHTGAVVQLGPRPDLAAAVGTKTFRSRLRSDRRRAAPPMKPSTRSKRPGLLVLLISDGEAAWDLAG